MTTEKISEKLAQADNMLWTWTTNKAGQHPVKVRITFDRKRKYYTCQMDGKEIFLTQKQYTAVLEKPRGENKQIRDAVDECVSKARKAIQKTTANGKQFTFDQFEKNYVDKAIAGGLFTWFENYLAELRAGDRIGTYKAYGNALAALKRFRNDKDINPADITPAFLREFDTWLSAKCGKNTIAIYMRGLKVIYNIVASDNPSLLELYPFSRKQKDKGKYQIKTGSGKKGEALELEQLQAFINTKVSPGSIENESKILWLFSFYCQGMNFRDMAMLKYQDVRFDSIRYVRNKTRYTEASQAIMEVPMTEPVKNIIIDVGNPDKSPDAYVFNIIPKGLASNCKRRAEHVPTPAERIDAIIHQKIKITNQYLKSICKDSKEDALKGLQLTTYWARHTYANLLKQSGESVDMIRELLGHSEAKTTESYLNRFSLGKKQAANEKIYATLKVS